MFEYTHRATIHIEKHIHERLEISVIMCCGVNEKSITLSSALDNFSLASDVWAKYVYDLKRGIIY